MESIQQAITGAVPSLTAEKVTAVMTELQSKGFFEFDDLRYLDCEKDLAGILLPVELRKLSAKMKIHFAESPGMCPWIY